VHSGGTSSVQKVERASPWHALDKHTHGYAAYCYVLHIKWRAPAVVDVTT